MIEVKSEYGHVELKTKGSPVMVTADLVLIMDAVKKTLPEEELPVFKSYLQDVVSDKGDLWMTEAQRKELLSRTLGRRFLDMMEAFFAERIPQQKGTAADESGT